METHIPDVHKGRRIVKKPKTIDEAIRLAGGEATTPRSADVLARHALRSDHPVTAYAILKWRYRGIPERHWALFRNVCTFDDLYKLNRNLD